MSVLPIVMWPDRRLSCVCDSVDLNDAETAQNVQNMFDTMYHANGRGLAAPQVGLMQRMFVMDVTWKDGAKSPVACINPEIRTIDEQTSINEEACLSIPNFAADVKRISKVELRYSTVTGGRETHVLDGFAAICAQHEMDHLNGLVIFDHLEATKRTTLEQEYLDALQ